MQIHGLQQSHAVQSLGSTERSKPATGIEANAPNQLQAADELDLSAEAQALSQAKAVEPPQASSPVRWEKVDTLRQAIASGTYETPERMSAALDRVLDTFA